MGPSGMCHTQDPAADQIRVRKKLDTSSIGFIVAS
jgi:hypothetical protein